VLRAALHLLLSWSMIAGPPAVHEGAGETATGGEPPPGSVPPVALPEPPADAPASEAPTGAPTQPTRESEPPATTETTPPTPPAAAPAQPEGPVDDEGEAAEEVLYDPLVDSPEAQRARSWVRSGAVFTGIGGVLTIGAIAMSQAKVNTMAEQNACDPRQDKAGNGCLEGARDRATAALAIPGALLLAGGIAMLIAGKVQQKRLRANLRASRREVMVGLQWTF
jgi:hypothetical protein